MPKKVKQPLSFDEDVHKAIKEEAKKQRSTMSGVVNKTMADKLKVKS